MEKLTRSGLIRKPYLQVVSEIRKRKRNKLIPMRTPQLEDVSELIHRIQSFLPAAEAARTCILSKSWLDAWSTIPTLRFIGKRFQQLTNNKYKLIDCTLLRYDRDNIPIETFDLQLRITNQMMASLVKKWIQHVASKTSLKEVSLRFCFVRIDSFTLPDEIFSNQKLNTLHVDNQYISTNDKPFWIGSNATVINCVSLRVLDLKDVTISQQVLDNLFSTCSLLEKVNITCCQGFKTIMVKNFRCLRELKIISIEEHDTLEIDDVPSLRLFNYSSILTYWKKPLPFNMDSLASLTQLYVGGVVMDDTFFNTIKSKFPLLECLSLGIGPAGPERLVITSASIKRLKLLVWVKRQMDVQVYAPNLQYFEYIGGEPKPSLSFPIIVPELSVR